LDIETEIRQVENLLQAGRLPLARQACRDLVNRAPDDFRGWRLAADVAMREQRATEAVEHIQKALQCAPEHAELMIQLAHYLYAVGRKIEARDLALSAKAEALISPHHMDALGTLLTRCGEALAALNLFERAVEAAPTNLTFRYNLAMAQRMAGALKDAEVNLDLVVAARPEDGEAHNARSGLRRQTRENNHIPELESILSRKAAHASVGVEFALAKELEDIAEFERSFAHLTHACGQVRARLRYNVETDVAVMSALRREHTRERLPLARATGSARCLFIIGLPRSGTTLVERILASHSEVQAGGEFEVFPQTVIEGVQKRGGMGVGKLEFVSAALELDFEELHDQYMAAVASHAAAATKFTDKLPLNYLYAGLIQAALPDARIIAMHRNPLDVCFAMYKTLFASAYPFTYDLMDLGRYYVAWDRLMLHWKKIIGDRWLTLNYEDLIAAPDEQVRRLLSHARLDWQSACLDFHRSPLAVATASAAQVRRPLYADSVERWKCYAKQLAPLQAYLEEQGIPCRTRPGGYPQTGGAERENAPNQRVPNL
jgi:tetratricopeptide (TPR) repeat protein